MSTDATDVCQKLPEQFVCGCTHITCMGHKSDCTEVNVSITTGFTALCICTHICICFLGDGVGFLERILVSVIMNQS